MILGPQQLGSKVCPAYLSDRPRAPSRAAPVEWGLWWVRCTPRSDEEALVDVGWRRESARHVTHVCRHVRLVSVTNRILMAAPVQVDGRVVAIKKIEVRAPRPEIFERHFASPHAPRAVEVHGG